MRELAERRLKELEVLALHLNGAQFGDYHDPAAAGVDAGGRKQVMGPCGRAPDNTTVTRRPLKALVARASEPTTSDFSTIPRTCSRQRSTPSTHPTPFRSIRSP